MRNTDKQLDQHANDAQLKNAKDHQRSQNHEDNFDHQDFDDQRQDRIKRFNQGLGNLRCAPDRHQFLAISLYSARAHFARPKE